MDLMLRGKSVIDSRRGLAIASRDAATRFLASYGYNLENPVEAAELLGNYQEALQFIRKYFLKPEAQEGAELEIPKMFFEVSDVRDLFVWAGDKSLLHEDVFRMRWACAVLRVMHTISHIDKDLRHDYFSSIQQQVFDRFYKELHNVDGKLFLGDPRGDGIELVKFQTKPRKARDSLVIKLLHKAENVAEEVFDQVGVRFVTKTAVDTVRVLMFLNERNIVMPMNLRPSRSRNNLVDPLVYRRTWRVAKREAKGGILHSRAEVDGLMERALESAAQPALPESRAHNPFSNASYRSIQFTCRQLIKFRNPAYEQLKALRSALKGAGDPAVKAAVEQIDISKLTREQRFFYPFEVQIVDHKNHLEAESGQASHAAYKAAQQQMAMKRVLGQLLDP
ncbi:MAG: TIGR04552 family protein [Bdellovibrionales bacterium]|nr:TIGR04552 family protein [Bdellovibrionales bacterium]